MTENSCKHVRGTQDKATRALARVRQRSLSFGGWHDALKEGFVYQGEASAHRGGKPRGTPSADLPPTAFVLFLQNHDQIGNRAFGERSTSLAEPAALEAAIALQLLCPQIPFIFMGEETATDAPFLFFTDHNEKLAQAVREGRRREFASFPQFSDPTLLKKIPDPNDEKTFERSHPFKDQASDHRRKDFYKRLLGLRRVHHSPPYWCARNGCECHWRGRSGGALVHGRRCDPHACLQSRWPGGGNRAACKRNPVRNFWPGVEFIPRRTA